MAAAAGRDLGRAIAQAGQGARGRSRMGKGGKNPEMACCQVAALVLSWLFPPPRCRGPNNRTPPSIRAAPPAASNPPGGDSSWGLLDVLWQGCPQTFFSDLQLLALPPSLERHVCVGRVGVATGC